MEISLENKIIPVINHALKACFDLENVMPAITLQPTRKEFGGQFTFVVFPYIKQMKCAPEQAGSKIGEYLLTHTDFIKDFNVVKGFLNLSISDQQWIQTLQTITSIKNYGEKPKVNEIVVEYSSPNTNKPLHLGHLRNNFLGNAVSRILEANGSKVHKIQIINDRGIHICKSMLAWSKFGNGETPESAGIKGDQLVGKYYVKFDQEYKKEIENLVAEGMEEKEAEKQAPILVEARQLLKKWEQKDPEVYALWKKMNAWVYAGFDETYTKIGVDFDKLYYESETYALGKEIVLKGLEDGLFYQKEDNSIWVDLEEEKLDHKILLRADGTTVYMTQDIGTAILRFRDFPKMTKLIYTVGNEQEYHFKVLFAILSKLGYNWAKENYHLSYGMVDLPTGKMKSREGTVVDADDLYQEMLTTAENKTAELGKTEGFNKEELSKLYRQIGLGALKYYILKVDPKKRMMFNPEESIDFQGNTASFIQYTYARVQSLLRKGKEKEKEIDWNSIQTLDKTEEAIIKHLYDFPQKINLAATEYSPAIIGQYVYDMAKIFNRFYQNVSIFKSSEQQLINFRLVLANQVALTIKKGMDLLGIEVPNQM